MLTRRISLCTARECRTLRKYGQPSEHKKRLDCGYLKDERFNDVPSPCFSFCSDESSSLGYTTESFTEVASAANERDFEPVLVDVVLLISRGENLGLVNVVDSNCLQNLYIIHSQHSKIRSRIKTDCRLQK